MSEEKILDRVRKMLALANDQGATEGERDNALRMAHNLLTKYNLTHADVDARAKDKDDPRGKYENTGWSMAWARQVRNSIAKLFMCTYFYGDKINATRCEHAFVGRESNATTAMWMSDFIINGILKEARKLYVHNLSPQSRSFAIGAADKLRARVNEMRATKAKELASTGTDLVLRKLEEEEADANEAYIAANVGALVVKKAREKTVCTEAYRAGVAYGETISLNTQVTATRNTRMLK